MAKHKIDALPSVFFLMINVLSEEKLFVNRSNSFSMTYKNQMFKGDS